MIDALRRLGGNLWMVDNAYTGAFVDNVGAQPVTAYADLLGLTTDRLGVLGANLFTGTYALGASTTATYSGGEATATFGGTVLASANNWLSIPGNTAAGTFSVIEYWATYVSGGNLEVGSTWQVGDTITAASNGGVRRRYTTRVRTGYAGIGWGPASFGATSAGSVWKVEVISVRELTGSHATQSAVASKPSVQRVPKRLGPELVVNGDFAAAVGWSLEPAGGVASIAGGVLTLTSTAGARVHAINSGVDAPGKTYQVTVKASSVSGSIVFSYNGEAANFVLSNGTNVFTYTALGINQFVLKRGAGAASAVIDDFSVKEVLEWANVISYDGANDFLTTGITSGNEGWLTAGVTMGTQAIGQTIVGNGAASGTDSGIWVRVGSTVDALVLLLGNGTTRDIISTVVTPMLNVPRVVEAGWNASTLSVGIDGVVASAAKTVNPTRATPIAIGNHQSWALSGPMHAIAYAPVLPDAATRKVIRDGIAALQGRTL